MRLELPNTGATDDAPRPSARVRGLRERIASTVREFGLWTGLLYGADRVLSRLCPRCRLFAYDLMVQPVPQEPLAPRRGSRLQTRELPPTATELLRMPIRREVLQSRLEQGATCLGAFRGEEMIGYMWFCWRPYEEDEARCTYVFDPQSGAVFDFDLYLFPEHRMGMGFMALWNGANDYLRAHGVRATFSRVTRFNLASHRAHRHLGARRVGQAYFLQLGRFQGMVSTLAPYVHLSMRSNGRVRLRLNKKPLSAAKPNQIQP
jgi:hypothetical protein